MDHVNVPNIQFSRVEHKFLSLYQRFGGAGAIASVTAFSVLVSVGITMAFYWPIYLRSGDAWGALLLPLMLSSALPTICAPLGTFFFARLLQRLEAAVDIANHLATVDPLTGVLNRRGFFAAVDEKKVNMPDAAAFLVGILDCDRFKSINDAYGHACGDAALVSLAQTLQECVAQHGYIGRLGGDEFAFFIAGDEAFLQRKLAEITDACQRIAIDLPEPGGSIELHNSIGTALRRANETLESALERSDRELYASKQSPPERHLRRSDEAR